MENDAVQFSYMEASQPAPHRRYYDDSISLKRPPIDGLYPTLDVFHQKMHPDNAIDDEDDSDSDSELASGDKGKDKYVADDEDEKRTWKEKLMYKCIPCKKDPKAKPKKFGTWDGVCVSCLLNIFGVIMFLRLGWVLGNAGIWGTFIIIGISTLVTTITTLSMSAVVTNGKMCGGGAYYLISRSLGPQFGGVIGLLFSFGNSVAIALYLLGFGESLIQLLDVEFGLELFGPALDIRIYGLIPLFVLLIMALIGVGWVIKMQLFLLALILFVMFSVLFGSFGLQGTSDEKGFTGWEGENFTDKQTPDFADGETFFTVFAVFFPAVTGIMAGANISGDLKNPSVNIPLGTLMAILISTIGYILLALFLAFSTVTEVLSGSDAPATSSAPSASSSESEEGLIHNFLIMTEVSFWGPLVYTGVFAATLSSGLASLVGAPRLFQAVCKDRLFPKYPFNFFAKGKKKTDDPIRAYFLAFAVAFGFICIGDLNFVAPIISMFFMLTYALINLACFTTSYYRVPGWRPTFKYYSKWVSLFGFFLCIAAMFLINWWSALTTMVVAALIFFYLYKKHPDVNWGPAGDWRKMNSALTGIMGLKTLKSNAKSYRPHFLFLTGKPERRPELLQFAYFLKGGKGLVVFGNVVIGDWDTALSKYEESFGDGYLQIGNVHWDSSDSDLEDSAIDFNGSDDEIADSEPATPTITIDQAATSDCSGDDSDRFEGSSDPIDSDDSNEGESDHENSSNDSDASAKGAKKARKKKQKKGKRGQKKGGDKQNADNVSTGEEISDNEGETVHQRPDPVLLKSGSLLVTRKILPENQKDIQHGPTVVKKTSRVLALPGKAVRKAQFWKSKPGKIHKLTAVVDTVLADSVQEGARVLLQTSGLGKVRPNCVVFGWKRKWRKNGKARREEYVATIRDAFQLRKSVLITRGFETLTKEIMEKKPGTKKGSRPRGTIDIWWLIDDGGLPLLIPYIMQKRKYWKKCKMRVFWIPTSIATAAKQSAMMRRMIKDFRFDAELIDVDPAEVAGDGTAADDWIDENNFDDVDRSTRYFHISQLIRKYSKDKASLVYCTLPFPKADVSARVYLSWLDKISEISVEDTIPFVLIRGNRDNVLSFAL